MGVCFDLRQRTLSIVAPYLWRNRQLGDWFFLYLFYVNRHFRIFIFPIGIVFRIYRCPCFFYCVIFIFCFNDDFRPSSPITTYLNNKLFHF